MPASLLRPPPDVACGVDLTRLNTLGLAARAARMAVIREAGEVAALARRPGWHGERLLVLGGGSNVVLTGDFPGLVLKVEIGGRALVAEDADAWYVRAGAGEGWHAFVLWTLEQGWPGLENLSLIPGTVGAAPIQNIGAYGLEMAERFASLEAVSLSDGAVRRFDREECRFGYRDSVFKREEAGHWLITAVTFRLPRRWVPVAHYAELARELEAQGLREPAPSAISDAVIAIRSRKLPDPAVLGNAGSYFKNPVVDAAALDRLLRSHPQLPHHAQADGTHKLAAGWLIDHCGWKGRDLGPVGCFERQALVLVNRGGASGKDVQRLARAIQEDVRAAFGIELEPEPVLV